MASSSSSSSRGDFAGNTSDPWSRTTDDGSKVRHRGATNGDRSRLDVTGHKSAASGKGSSHRTSKKGAKGDALPNGFGHGHGHGTSHGSSQSLRGFSSRSHSSGPGASGSSRITPPGGDQLNQTAPAAMRYRSSSESHAHRARQHPVPVEATGSLVRQRTLVLDVSEHRIEGARSASLVGSSSASSGLPVTFGSSNGQRPVSRSSLRSRSRSRDPSPHGALGGDTIPVFTAADAMYQSDSTAPRRRPASQRYRHRLGSHGTSDSPSTSSSSMATSSSPAARQAKARARGISPIRSRSVPVRPDSRASTFSGTTSPLPEVVPQTAVVGVDAAASRSGVTSPQPLPVIGIHSPGESHQHEERIDEVEREHQDQKAITHSASTHEQGLDFEHAAAHNRSVSPVITVVDDVSEVVAAPSDDSEPSSPTSCHAPLSDDSSRRSSARLSQPEPHAPLEPRSRRHHFRRSLSDSIAEAAREAVGSNATTASSSRPNTAHLQWERGSSRPQTAASGAKPRYGACTIAGHYGGISKTNQDDFAVFEQGDAIQRSDNFLVSVMDGHGEHGHYVSSFVSKELGPRMLQSYRASTPSTALRTAVEGSASALTKTGIDAWQSGTTAVSCFRRGNTLYVANVGDSRCILGRLSSRGAIRPVLLSKDHKPSDKTELQRIKKHGGFVEPTRVPGMGFQGPARVWRTRQKEGGLALSRSIGDLWLGSAGVVPTPDMVTHTIQPEDKFVVLASDGVWDQLSNQEACSLAYQHIDDPRVGSRAIARLARQRWLRRGGGYADDITAVVVKL